MSCQIKVFANIVDIPGVRRYLFPWDDDRGSENWLHNCLTSISPTGEIIVFVNNNRIIVLSAKWDSNTTLNQFYTSYTGALDSDLITSVLCLPIASQSQSSQMGPDWTCIAVGLKTGEVKFYTENCILLHVEQFYDEYVVNIKCQSNYSIYAESGIDFRPEELYIQYPKCVCVVAGSQLFTILRNNRSQLARGAESFVSFNTLIHKKWGICDQFEINDAAVVGLDTSNTFNHLLTASTCGGFDSRYRAMAPNNTLIMGAGAKPYVGFHYALEGGMQPLLSDVAKAVASKLKSALPGWLTGNKSTSTEKNPSTLQPAEAVGCRFGLCDIRRIGDSIILSPNKKLSVVTDSLGRIVLIDNFRGVIIRMWKGYRGAQCAFLQVLDEERNRHVTRSKRRVALFLIIYVPKKGIIDIWAIQQGPKITTFSASKNSKLIYTNYGLMGIENPKMKHNYNTSCFLFDPDGQIKEVIIPFHFSLTEKNSKRARDLHLYKRLKQFFKSEDFNYDKLNSEVSFICSELKTNEIRAQCFDTLISNKLINSKALYLMIDSFLEKLTIPEDPDLETNRLITLINNLKLVLDLYTFLEDFNDIDAENGNLVNVSKEEADKDNKIDTRFVLGDKDMYNLQRLLDLNTLSDNQKKSEIKVTFYEEKKSLITEFLSIFDLTDDKNQIKLKKDVVDDKLFRVSEQIFHSFILSKRNDFELLKYQLLKSSIRTLDLIKMVLNYWINRPLDINVNLEEEMQNISKVLYIICSITNTENICVEYNKTSAFWTEIREYLTNSAKPFPALTAAILCRSVAQRIEQEKEAQHCSATSLEEESTTDIWEKLSQENCQWTLLIGKLEDVSLLNIILSNKPICDNCPLPKLFYDRVVVSLKFILQKGKGSVSELVAQWLATIGVNPDLIIFNEFSNISEENQSQSSRPQSEEIVSPINPVLLQKDLNINQPVFDHLNILKKQFPYSLESSALLANIAWEYSLNWQKDNNNVSYLDAAAKCLKNIPNAHIKQGLYNLIWNTHLKQTFESVCKLINKVGKVPKEILCRQDTGLSDLQIQVFVEFCTNFLDAFMDSVQQCYGLEKHAIHFENIWENGTSPLTELALQQSDINDSLLHIHYQLSLIIQFITTFGIKQTKPVQNLFDSYTVNQFFSDLTSPNVQINTRSSEPKLLNARKTFLMKVIEASIETVRVVDDDIYFTDHVNWMAKCLSLANVWGIDTDLFRRYQVMLLYTNGFNTLSEEILPSVGNTEALGEQLLEIAGKQLKKLLVSSTDLTKKIVALSPIVSQYLDFLDNNWCAPGSLDSIIHLAEYAVRYLPETNNLNRLATSLLDACVTLKGMENQ